MRYRVLGLPLEHLVAQKFDSTFLVDKARFSLEETMQLYEDARFQITLAAAAHAARHPQNFFAACVEVSARSVIPVIE